MSETNVRVCALILVMSYGKYWSVEKYVKLQ